MRKSGSGKKGRTDKLFIMNQLDFSAFANLFKDAYQKCFGYPLEIPLTETESKLFCNQILDQTGLVIGWKSVKNYSSFILNDLTGKQENPSFATLDTLGRYVLNAPYTDEIQRKRNENHYPYWFNYKDQYYRSFQKSPAKKIPHPSPWYLFVGPVLFILILLILSHTFYPGQPERFTEDFLSVEGDSLSAKGWFVRSRNPEYWNKRGEKPGRLALFTLKGDNWPDSAQSTGIQNLLLRKISGECFTAEVHLTDFTPLQEWQQAGMLLLEDTLFAGKSMRLSVSFNDYFGEHPGSGEILIQAITSLGNGFGKPEEIAHTPILWVDSLGRNPALIKNLENSALRIEKEGKRFRLLYAGGIRENSAFKEVISQDFDMEPNYIGLFALKGFVNESANIPAHFKYFSLTTHRCNK
jgi:hypothetical protein